jgi:hypothetical protein
MTIGEAIDWLEVNNYTEYQVGAVHKYAACGPNSPQLAVIVTIPYHPPHGTNSRARCH